MSSTFDIGDQPTVVVTFKDAGGTLADPTAITFSVLAPAGTAVSEDQTNATNPSTGIWHWELPSAIDRAGKWQVRAAATLGLICAVEDSFHVRDSDFV